MKCLTQNTLRQLTIQQFAYWGPDGPSFLKPIFRIPETFFKVSVQNFCKQILKANTKKASSQDGVGGGGRGGCAHTLHPPPRSAPVVIWFSRFIIFLLISDSFPELWEVPLVDYNSKDGRLCNIIDSCTPPRTVQEALELFDSNFKRHYTTNRAPFFMLLEEEWLANSTYFEGMYVNSLLVFGFYFAYLYRLISLMRKELSYSDWLFVCKSQD